MPRTTLLLVRHGARFDYANKEAWKERCAKLGLVAADPPLSSLGHAQARQTAEALAHEAFSPPISVLLSSPYLRVLQTAQPLAHALNLSICVEHCLAEFGHAPALIPPPAARVSLMPEVDESFTPLIGRECGGVDPATGKETTVDYFRRLIAFADALRAGKYRGETIACFSHAASVALIAALTRCPTLREAGLFAPCGVWVLVSDDDRTWRVERRGDTNAPHVTSNDPTTFPWGFEHGYKPEAYEKAWQQALQMGAADLGREHSAHSSALSQWLAWLWGPLGRVASPGFARGVLAGAVLTTALAPSLSALRARIR